MTTQFADPVSAIAALWSVSTVGNIDDAVRSPAAGDGLEIRASYADFGEQQQYVCGPPPSGLGGITSVKVWFRAYSNSGVAIAVTPNFRSNGTWYAGSAVSVTTIGWYSQTFTGSYGDVSTMAPAVGLLNGNSSKSRELLVDVIYLEITHTPAPTEQYAISSGSWSTPGIWSTGTVPYSGTVYANGNNVTVDANASATVVTTLAGTAAAAGGGFFLANGVTLTANAYAGTSTCVSVTGVGYSATLIGDLYGSNSTVNRYGAVASATNSVLNVLGNSYGGSQTNSYGIASTSTTSTVNLLGNSHGGDGSGAAGARATGGTLNLTGNAYGSATGSGAGVYYTGSTTSGTINGNAYGANSYGVWMASAGTLVFNGDSIGGANGSASGLYIASSATVTVNGTSTGGSAATAYGLNHVGTGVVTVTTAASSSAAAGVFNAGNGSLTIGNAVTHASGISPCAGLVNVTNLSTVSIGVRDASSGVTLSADVDTPSPFRPPVVFGSV